MKRMVCILICLMLLLTLAVPVMAANMQVQFTDDSSFVVGGTVTPDEGKMMYDPNCTSEVYNALLEGDVQYYWFRNDAYYADGSSLTLKDADQGYTFYCQAVFYSDADHIQQCATLYSAKFTVPAVELPEITTKSLPDGTVGESYYQKLTCTDPDVTFGLLQSSLPDGLYLTQHGEIEGTPTKAGFWYVVIIVCDEYGRENTAQFEMTIQEKPDHTHTPSKWRTTQVYHYTVCTTCGDMLDQEDHMGGKASCVEKGSCTVCGYAYLPETEDHVPETKWTACADLYHAHLCELCGAHCDPEEHIPGPEATEKAPQVCTVCNYIMVPAKNHVHDLIQVQAEEPTCTEPGNKVHYACKGCNDLFADNGGKEKIADPATLVLPALGHDLKDGKCAVCGYTVAGSEPTDPTGATEPTAPAASDDSLTTGVQTPPENPDDGTEPANDWMLWVFLGFALVIVAVTAIVVTLIIVKNKKKN